MVDNEGTIGLVGDLFDPADGTLRRWHDSNGMIEETATSLEEIALATEVRRAPTLRSPARHVRRAAGQRAAR